MMLTLLKFESILYFFPSLEDCCGAIDLPVVPFLSVGGWNVARTALLGKFLLGPIEAGLARFFLQKLDRASKSTNENANLEKL